MKILNCFMSKRKRFHLTISGSLEEYDAFYHALSKTQSFVSGGMTVKVSGNKEPQASIICKSSNYKKFSQELNKLIEKYTQ